jgi:3-methylfumaryl-CoA hydratase
MKEDFQDWVGRRVTREDVVTPRLLAEFRATLGPYLFDDGGSTCPPGLHACLAPAIPAMADTGPDGAERKGLFLPPVPFPRRMWAGGMIETLQPLQMGASIVRVSTIGDIRFKRGATGELCLVSVHHEISGEHGLAVRERQDLVFREASAGLGVKIGPEQPIIADWKVDASPVLLFRFSAMTFNGHRIHFDFDHARAEGYPGLLVHGPMQAVLMLNLLAIRHRAVPRQFAYRCLAPLPSGHEFGVASDESGSVARILRHDGVVTAEGEASGDHAG